MGGMEMLTNLIVVVILQYMCASNHYFVHFKLTYVTSILSQ